METRRTNTNAIIGFGLSLGGYFTNMSLGILLIIAGFIFSIIGFVQIKERGEKGKVFAILGFILSLLVFILAILASLYPELLDY